MVIVSKARTRRPGSTAVVTGASSGIGRALACQLAAGGHQLVLVARGKDRLVELANELNERHRVAVEVLPADLSLDEDVASVARRIGEDDEVGIVVNNAGVGWYGSFAAQPAGSLATMLAVNVGALTTLSRAALEPMVSRRCGALLNVSSTASAVPGPRAAVYHATKAYVSSFTEALHEEARPYGVHVTALCPGFTPTGFQQHAGCRPLQRLPRFLLSDADAVAAAGLSALERNEAVCVPGVLNKLSVLAARLGPRPAVRWGSRQVLARL